MPNNVETYDGTGDPKDHVKFFQAAAQQKMYVKDPVEIHNIKQRDGETISEFMERFKVETERMKGAPECMRISGFMHGVNNPELTKRLNEHVPKTMEEMMTAITAFIRGEIIAASKKKGHTSWKPHDQPKRHVSEQKSDFRGKLSHLIKEIKQGRDQPKVGKKEVPAKDKSMAIYMVQPWHRMTRQRVTQGFARVSKITFPPLAISRGRRSTCYRSGNWRAHDPSHVCRRGFINRNTLRATTSLTGFSGETIWPLGQLMLLVTIGDAEHSTKAWMNFMIVRSLSPYNGIVTIRSTILIPADCATVTTSSKKIFKEAEVRHENFKKKMGQAPERAKAIQAEIQKLVEAGIKREVYYYDWLSNPVMVKKHDSSWRMCVDFIDLNKACPQDCYPLPEINWKVESLYGYPYKSFLDAYKGYHQIQMAESDKEKTAFHTSHGVTRTLVPHTSGCHTETEMLRDIDETFCTLRKLNMKLNPKKCTFGAVEGTFLGYMISPEGIKPCPDKKEAVLRLPSPRTIKEVQSLNGKLASLNKFLSKSAEKSLPLFKTLKKCIKKSDFHWTPEAEQAFRQLKKTLVGTTHAGSTQTKGGIDCILVRLPQSY
ncbi:hypothetical protein Tco_1137718 [Tanacetum coccineum]